MARDSVLAYTFSFIYWAGIGKIQYTVITGWDFLENNLFTNLHRLTHTTEKDLLFQQCVQYTECIITRIRIYLLKILRAWFYSTVHHRRSDTPCRKLDSGHCVFL